MTHEPHTTPHATSDDPRFGEARRARPVAAIAIGIAVLVVALVVAYANRPGGDESAADAPPPAQTIAVDAFGAAQVDATRRIDLPSVATGVPVTGWAIDAAAAAPASRVVVVVDGGEEVEATAGMPRDDVAAALGNDAYAAAGYEALIPSELLPTGEREVVVRAFDEAGDELATTEPVVLATGPVTTS